MLRGYIRRNANPYILRNVDPLSTGLLICSGPAHRVDDGKQTRIYLQYKNKDNCENQRILTGVYYISQQQ